MKRSQFITTLLLLVLLLVLLLGEAMAQKQPLPKFEDYPAQERFSGHPVQPKLTSKRARLFLIDVGTEAAKGPNFAGHYRIARWGCGTECVQFAIINCKTGDVYFPWQVESVGPVVPPGQDDDVLEYRIDSQMLVVAGGKHDFQGHNVTGKFFYEWKNNRLVLIRKVNLKL